MDITFVPLAPEHFSLLLDWFEAPHVKLWWAPDVVWTPELIREKFGSYVEGYKLDGDIKKPIHPYIICADKKPIGYIQIYNAHDFSHAKSLQGFPPSLAALDILIGEENYLRRGVGVKSIREFLDNYFEGDSPVFVDPNSENTAAIRAYEKAGFIKVGDQPETGEIWMIREPSSKHG